MKDDGREGGGGGQRTALLSDVKTDLQTLGIHSNTGKTATCYSRRAGRQTPGATQCSFISSHLPNHFQATRGRLKSRGYLRMYSRKPSIRHSPPRVSVFPSKHCYPRGLPSCRKNVSQNLKTLYLAAVP